MLMPCVMGTFIKQAAGANSGACDVALAFIEIIGNETMA